MPRPSVATTSVVEERSASAATPAGDCRLRVVLDTSEAQQALSFAVVAAGRGRAILVAACAAGSEAEVAGVRVGQQLLALSDPIRQDEVWSLNERVSLRYVRDALRMRRCDTLALELSLEPRAAAAASDPDPAGDPGGPRAGAATGAEQAAGQRDAAEGSGGLIEALEQAASRGEAPGGSVPAEPLSIGQRLELQRMQQQAQQPALAASEHRTRRKREYLETTTQRNDAPFFAGLLLLFVVPAAVILGVAASTGYLDTLAAHQF